MWSHKMEMPLVTIVTHAVLPCCSLPLYIESDDYDAVNTALLFVSGTTRGGAGSQKCVSIVIVSMDGFELNETFLLSADSFDLDVTFSNNNIITIIILNSDGK